MSTDQTKNFYFAAPIKADDPKISVGYKTIWQCVFFGEYPQAEVVAAPFGAVDQSALSPGDVIEDTELFTALEAASWQNGKAIVQGKRYLRITGKDAVTATRSGRHHYRWKNVNEYHYFLFQPIRWRVLDEKNGILTLIADRTLDCRQFNDTPGKTCWADCSLRKWLNGEFADTAFSDDEKAGLIETETDNRPNMFYGTDSGPDTRDRVYILSNDEVFAADTAAQYGFFKGLGKDDAAKRFSSTAFAKCRGAWWSPTSFCPGNAFWFMRTSGYSSSAVTYVCDLGYIYSLGTEAVCDDAGILPVIRVDAKSIALKEAGTSESLPFSIVVKMVSPQTDTSDKSPNREYMTFGSYPQTEIISSLPFDSVDDYAIETGDFIVDSVLIETLERACFENDVTTVGGVRYIRCLHAAADEKQHYRSFGNAYHYFRFDPVKWRILRREDGRIYLLSAKSLDCRIFNESSRHVSWENSSLRRFLNEEFYHSAFSHEERKRILACRNENRDNLFFEASSGENTWDYVTVPSEEDVFHTEKSLENGFRYFSFEQDDARKIASSMYSKFMGTWWSPSDSGKGNCYWFLRTSGYNTSNIVYVSENGDILNRGCYVSVPDGGIVPEICITEDDC